MTDAGYVHNIRCESQGRGVKRISLVSFEDAGGSLSFVESGCIDDFDIHRVFWVKGVADSVRGNHAHIECSQILFCLSGTIKVNCFDGRRWLNFVLDSPNEGLLIPPKIWAEQEYVCEGSILLVVCNRTYSESDYIRDFSTYCSFIGRELR